MRAIRFTAGAIALVLAVTALGQEKEKDKPFVKLVPKGLAEVEGRSLPEWIQDLKSPDASVRERAVTALPLFGLAAGSAEVINPLLDVLKNKDRDTSPRVRALMALAMLDIPKDDVRKVISTLTALLDDEQGIIRYYAVQALLRFGGEAHPAVGKLQVTASDQVTWEIRRATLAALAQCGRTAKGADPRATSAFLKHSSPSSEYSADVRIEAAIGLGATGKPTDALTKLVEQQLEFMTRDKDKRVVIWARVSKMAHTGVTETALNSIAAMLRDSNVQVRLQACRALGTVGKEAKPVQSKLIDALSDKEPAVQFMAVQALVALGDRGPGLQMVLKELGDRKDADPFVRLMAQQANEYIRTGKPGTITPEKILADYKPPAPTPPTDIEGKSLAQWLHDLKGSDPGLRERALGALPFFGTEAGRTEVLTALLDRCHDTDASPRTRAVQTLLMLEIPKSEVPRVVTAMCTRLKDDRQANIRYYAALVLLRLGEDAHPAVSLLAKMAADKGTWELRRASLAALNLCGRTAEGADPEATKAFVLASKDSTSEVRVQAAMGLGATGKPLGAQLEADVDRALDQLAADPDRWVALWALASRMTLHDVSEQTLRDIASSLQDKSAVVRANAIGALGALGKKALPVRDKLMLALNDKEVGVKNLAVLALVRMADQPEKALPAVLKEISQRQDLNKDVRQVATQLHDALQKVKKDNK
jgi:HEAT repeat protein